MLQDPTGKNSGEPVAPAEHTYAIWPNGSVKLVPFSRGPPDSCPISAGIELPTEHRIEQTARPTVASKEYRLRKTEIASETNFVHP